MANSDYFWPISAADISEVSEIIPTTRGLTLTENNYIRVQTEEMRNLGRAAYYDSKRLQNQNGSFRWYEKKLPEGSQVTSPKHSTSASLMKEGAHLHCMHEDSPSLKLYGLLNNGATQK